MKFEVITVSSLDEDGTVQIYLDRLWSGGVVVRARRNGIMSTLVVFDTDGYMHIEPGVSEKLGFKLLASGTISTK